MDQTLATIITVQLRLRRLPALLCVVMLWLATPAFAYQNPILGPINDPDCVQMDGVYHLIEPEGGSTSAHFNYRTSTDLTHWSSPVAILKQPKGTALWQGSYFRDTDGTLYLYYAAVADGHVKTVHVAKAASFTGPFTNLGVIVTGAIDPYPLRDATGTLWLYYKNDLPGQKGIWVQRMSGPATVAAQPATEILHPVPSTFEDSGYLSVEGPTVIVRAGLYFLLYSGGPFNKASYAVGYAYSREPDGPFTRGDNNPILSVTATPDVFSPGAVSVVQDGAGASWLVYRQRQSAKLRSPRVLAIDLMDDSHAGDGILSVNPSSGSVQPDPMPLR